MGWGGVISQHIGADIESKMALLECGCFSKLELYWLLPKVMMASRMMAHGKVRRSG